MGIKIEFDVNNNAIQPTFVLSKRNGEKLGAIPVSNLRFKDSFGNYAEMSFRVYKTDHGIKQQNWGLIDDFKLLWCREWDAWFEISVDINSSTSEYKDISCKALGAAELSQVFLYNIEINGDEETKEDGFLPTILYDANNHETSLLHRILEKVPHYSIDYVSGSIVNIQRTFSFDKKTIYDSLQEVAKEINCVVVIEVNSDINGKPNRTISLYDLEAKCYNCGKRGEFQSVCPDCGSTNILEGYGNDTAIFVSKNNLAENIKYSTNVDYVKNCFKLEAGDDLMTATIKSCAPSGSDYIWYFPEDMRSDMSDELRKRLSTYEAKISTYNEKSYSSEFNGSLKANYNSLVTKYNNLLQSGDRAYLEQPSSINGYPNIVKYYYDAIDFRLLLDSGLMPSAELSNTDAQSEGSKIQNGVTIAIANLNTIGVASTQSALLSYLKTIVDSRYQLKVSVDADDLTFILSADGKTRESGEVLCTINITNYYDETDSTTVIKSFNLSDAENDYVNYINQKIDKVLSNEVFDDSDISALFKKNLSSFKTEINKHCLSNLISFHDSCQACIDVLIEQGISSESNPKANISASDNLYQNIFMPYYEKLITLEEEMNEREAELNIVDSKINEFDSIIARIKNELDFENHLGNVYYQELLTFRREDTYSNENFISDGLSNEDLLERAIEFRDRANNELIKSATLQHSITSTLKNLLVMKEFKPISEMFSVGNWIRLSVDDKLYKLRLLEYEINFSNLSNLSVTFSDVRYLATGASDIQDTINKFSSLSSSYNSVSRQAEKGEASSKYIDGWVEQGLDVTTVKIINSADNQNMTFDRHGLLLREYESTTDKYSDEQLKIINSTIAFTRNGWKSSHTAVGSFYYVTPDGNEIRKAYGINGETIVGKILLGEELGIYNSGGSLRFNKTGLIVEGNNRTTVYITPDGDSVIRIHNGTKNVFYTDSSGDVVLEGKITATSGKIGDFSITKLNNGTYTLRAGTSSDNNKSDIILFSRASVGNFGDTGTGFYVNSGNDRDSWLILAGHTGDGLQFNFGVKSNGQLQCNNAKIKGEITATSLTLSGDVKIPTSSIDGINNYATTANLTNYVETTTYNNDKSTFVKVNTQYKDGTTVNFEVSDNGLLQANNAIIYGQLHALSGTIGGWTISQLKNGTRFLASDTSNNPNIMLFSSPSSGTRDAESNGSNGYYVSADNFNVFGARDNWLVLVGRNSTDELGYKFGIKNDGSIYAVNAYITGKITATSGKIGEWNIDTWGASTDKMLYSTPMQFDGYYYSTFFRGKAGQDGNSYVVIGVKKNNTSNAANAKDSSWTTTNAPYVFFVDSKGKLFSNNANISGSITATSGKIGAFSISDNKLVYKNSNNSEMMGINPLANDSIASIDNCAFYCYGVSITQEKFVSALPITTVETIRIAENKLAEYGLLDIVVKSSTEGYQPYLDESCGSLYFKDSAGTNRAAVALGGTSGYDYSSKNFVIDARNSGGGAGGGTGRLLGTWYVKSALITTSDRTQKNSVANISELYSNFYDKIEPVVFKYNDGQSGRFHVGFIAQDIETALIDTKLTTNDFAGLVKYEYKKEGSNDIQYDYGLRYEEFIALNTNEIQKLKKRVAELERLLSVY